MDKSVLMFRGGVRSTKETLADGKEHTIHYKARTPDEISLFLGDQSRVSDDQKGDALRQTQRAQFIADSLCNEDGTPLMTLEEAKLIPFTLKPQLCRIVMDGSSEMSTDLGKG